MTNTPRTEHAAANRRLGLSLFTLFAVLTALAALYIALRPRR